MFKYLMVLGVTLFLVGLVGVAKAGGVKSHVSSGGVIHFHLDNYSYGHRPNYNQRRYYQKRYHHGNSYYRKKRIQRPVFYCPIETYSYHYRPHRSCYRHRDHFHCS